MAPVVFCETRSSFYNGTTLWTDFWSDILSVIRHHPPLSARTPTRRINKIEPLNPDLIGPSPPPTMVSLPPLPPQPDFLDSKFQVEYVSFPRLVEDEAISKDDDTGTFHHDEKDREYEKEMLRQQLSTTSPTPSRLGGSRRRLLGTPWMF